MPLKQEDNIPPYKYYGADNATHIIILMGSAAGTVKEVIEVLLARSKKGGVLIVHLFRPFSAPHLLNAIPESVNKIAILDRTKEPGAQAEPLHLDIMTAFAENFSLGHRQKMPIIIGGRYGLSSKK